MWRSGVPLPGLLASGAEHPRSVIALASDRPGELRRSGPCDRGRHCAEPVAAHAVEKKRKVRLYAARFVVDGGRMPLYSCHRCLRSDDAVAEIDEQITFTEQFLGAAAIQDDSGVHERLHTEGDPAV